MHVVVTAGHVDHGKSTLVRALTGQEPDRLAEERRRGLTIELGYVWTELTGAGGSAEVAFVDVPGHQRFVTTALAGMGPVPVAMLVVAADDPWMPQAAEHLAALDALGVDRGVLVVTRSDLADAAPILAEARRRLAATSLAAIPHVVVSGRTGAGLDALRTTLANVLARAPEPDAGAPVRLWIDRRFHVRGSGTVVTGTLPAGTIAPGDHLELGGSDVDGRVRVRGVEALGVRRDAVSAVARVALDLGGRAPTGIARGAALLTPGAYPVAVTVDVSLAGSGDPPERPVLHVGSASQQVRLRRLGETHARLRFDPALPLAVGDRAVLRDPGSRTVWGVRVLDVSPPPLTRRGAAAARAADLARGLPVEPEPASSPPVQPYPEPDDPDPDDLDPDDLDPDDLDPGDLAAADRLAGWWADLAAQPLAAPTADELAALGLDDATAVRLHRAGRLLRVAPGIVVRPDAAALTVARLADLDPPFSTSAARQALGTSRRVALPVLAHLDRAGHTVRLADDTRRLRQAADRD